MNRSNYALISALYDTEGANLYNDIYFPIIKYEITNQYYTQINIEKYYDLSELQNAISKDFGINIPLQVLKQSIRTIGHGDNDISISVFENGKQFKIKKAWDISLNVSIDTKSQEIETKFAQLELLFQRFLEIEQLSFEKTFSDFFADNTEEIFNYIEGYDNNVIIDENYVNVTRFLTWLKTENTELFNIANDIFWGSIIAGFLKRNTIDINIKPIKKVEYYLDTSLVLAILDLDNQDKVYYGQELLDIIKSSGNIPKVHSLTLREIKYILTSVENAQGPRLNSAIEDAYYRRNLTPTKILQIKNKLPKLIEEKEIIILPVSEKELDEIEIKYKNDRIVKDLKNIRNPTYNNYTIRDIHDVYLRDFIRKRRGNVATIEKINSYFVSLNSDLISYFKQTSATNVNSEIIHPAKIITDLWIHNSQCSLLKKSALTEVMSRCFALNNTDIKRKLQLVSKYFKETDTDYSEDTYRAIYSALINRSAKALKEIEEISTIEQENPTNKEEINRCRIRALIKISIDEKIRIEQDLMAKTKENELLSKDGKLKGQSLLEKEGQIDKLKEENEKLKRIDKITEQINEISRQISELEKAKEKSISMIKYWLFISLESVFIIGIMVSCLLLIISYLKNGNMNFCNYLKNNIKLFLCFCVSAIGVICRIRSIFIFSPIIQYYNIREEQIGYWINKNVKYNELKEQLRQLHTERDRLRV